MAFPPSSSGRPRSPLPPPSTSARQRGNSDASGSTVGKRAPAPPTGSQYGSAGRRKVRTEPPYARAQPPTPPDSPNEAVSASHLFTSSSSHHRALSSASGFNALAGPNTSRPGLLQELSPTRTHFSSDLSESSTQGPPGGPPDPLSRSTLGLDGSSTTGLGLAGVEEEDGETSTSPLRRPSWWNNPLSPVSFRGKFASGSSAGTAQPPKRPATNDGEPEKSYFPDILGGQTRTGDLETESPKPLDLALPLPATPVRARRASHRPNFRLSLPTPQPYSAYTQHHSKTPGWSEPYSAHPRRSISRHRDPEKGDTGAREGIKARIGRWTLYSFWTPLFLRLANFALTCTTLALGVRIRNLEAKASLTGITGSSPLVAIIFSPPALLHVLTAVYLEYFGKPIGLWSLPSKLLFTSLDLVVISLWASLLSLTISDIFTTPLHCAPESSRWWTNVQSSEPAQHVRGVCGNQIAMVVTVVVGVLGFGVGNVVSLARVWAKIVGRTGGGLGRRGG